MLLFRKNPEKIISGIKNGPVRPIAAFTEGAAADINPPNEVEVFATNITIKTHMKNAEAVLVKLAIQ